MRYMKSSQSQNAVYFLIGREGRYGMAASDIRIATGFSKVHVHRILHELMRLGAIRRIECYPDKGRPHYIYKDNDPVGWRASRSRLSRDYALLRLARGVSAFELIGSSRDMEGRND